MVRKSADAKLGLWGSDTTPRFCGPDTIYAEKSVAGIGAEVQTFFYYLLTYLLTYLLSGTYLLTYSLTYLRVLSYLLATASRPPLPRLALEPHRCTRRGDASLGSPYPRGARCRM